MRNVKTLFVASLAVVGLGSLALPHLGIAAGEGPVIETQEWSFAPPFGHFDRAQLQRGYKVYERVCANCHSMKLLSYRNLSEPGGPEFSEEAVEVLANKVQVPDGPDDTGEMFMRPAKPSDRFRQPYANDQAARAANNGALPPDLSVMAKARPGGPDYLYSLLTGYDQAPHDMNMMKGMMYNSAFPGHQIAMPNPLSDGVIEYTDGTAPTLDNYARDVSAFMMWAAEPKLEERYRIGAVFMLFLIVFAVIMYLAKRVVWVPEHKRRHDSSHT